MTSDLNPALIVVVGPTAVGKTEFALELAERFQGEIVSADSRLFYMGMDIGTAKPTQSQLARVPHHLINVTTPDQNWSLAQFQQKARQEISEIQERGHLPFLVGGTGQYIRAVTQEWDIPRVAPDPTLRTALEEWSAKIGAQGLHRRLEVIDPQAASSIDARNVRRTIRALEVILSTGKRFSAQKRQSKSPYHLFILGLTRPRQELYARIDARIEAMLNAGLVNEVQGLLKEYPSDLPAFSAIGYREIILYLNGKITLEEAARQIKRNTRIFVRRQANWFKNTDPDIHWLDVVPNIVHEAEKMIIKWMRERLIY
ncbi:MAG: tRNA (adenosine(37)-N6)-dimethylallyltransferase MiaA [Omnitrophica WOR_2 bacterium]